MVIKRRIAVACPRAPSEGAIANIQQTRRQFDGGELQASEERLGAEVVHGVRKYEGDNSSAESEGICINTLQIPWKC